MLHENKPHQHEGLEKYRTEPNTQTYSAPRPIQTDGGVAPANHTGVDTQAVAKTHKIAKLLAELAAVEGMPNYDRAKAAALRASIAALRS